MKNEISEVLKKIDQDPNREFPANFDHESHRSQIEAFNLELQHSLGRSLPLVRSEDASFTWEIVLNATPKSDEYWSRLVFSNFGNLVTLTDPDYESRSLQSIVELLSKHGYYFIPLEKTEEPYDGILQGSEHNIRDWFQRFFDYT